MSDTPRTDAKIVSQSFVDETRMFHRDDYVPLLEHARTMERELAAANISLAEAEKLATRAAKENVQFCTYCGLVDPAGARDGSDKAEFEAAWERMRAHVQVCERNPLVRARDEALACREHWKREAEACVHYAEKQTALIDEVYKILWTESGESYQSQVNRAHAKILAFKRDHGSVNGVGNPLSDDALIEEFEAWVKARPASWDPERIAGMLAAYCAGRRAVPSQGTDR